MGRRAITQLDMSAASRLSAAISSSRYEHQAMLEGGLWGAFGEALEGFWGCFGGPLGSFGVTLGELWVRTLGDFGGL